MGDNENGLVVFSRRGAVAIAVGALLQTATGVSPVAAWASTVSTSYPDYGIASWKWFLDHPENAYNYASCMAGTETCTVGANLGFDGGTLRVNHFEVVFKEGWCRKNAGTVIACPPEFIRQCAVGNTSGVTDDEHLPDSFVCIDWAAGSPYGSHSYLVWYVARIGSYCYYLVVVNPGNVRGTQRLAALWRVTMSAVKERVRCDFAGGSCQGASSWQSESMAKGNTVILPCPQRSGFVFTGWVVLSRTAGSAGMVIDSSDADGIGGFEGVSTDLGSMSLRIGTQTPNIAALSVSLQGAAAAYAQREGGGVRYRFLLDGYGVSGAGCDGNEINVCSTSDGRYYGPVTGLSVECYDGVAREYGTYYRLFTTADLGWTGWFSNGSLCELPNRRASQNAQVVVVPRDTDMIEAFGPPSWYFCPLTSLAANSVAEARLKATWEVARMTVNYFINGGLVVSDRLPQGSFALRAVYDAWVLAGRPEGQLSSQWFWDEDCTQSLDVGQKNVAWYGKTLNLYAKTTPIHKTISVSFAWSNQALALLQAGKIDWRDESGQSVEVEADSCLPDQEIYVVPPAVVWGDSRQPRYRPWTRGYGNLPAEQLTAKNYRDPSCALLLESLATVEVSMTVYLSLEARSFDAERSFL